VSPDVRRRWLLGLRWGVTAVAVVWVLRLVPFRDELRTVDGVAEVVRPGLFTLLKQTDPVLFTSMAAALLIPVFLMALRWWILLRGHGFAFPLSRIFFVTYAGTFFNNFLPGSVGGDLTKAVLTASGEERKAAIAGTVILDRLLGLAVMIVLGAVCITPFLDRMADRRLAAAVYFLAGAMLAGYLVYFSPLFRRILPRLPFQRVVAELDGVFRTAREGKGRVAAAAGLSVLAQASAILAIYGLGRAMGLQGAALWMFFAFEPVIFIVTALPISVGGWGVQEAVYRELFGGFGGVDPDGAVALSIVYKLSLILVSIPGGLLFGLGATRKRGMEPPAGTEPV
jgi:uncharacterized protein (TIRG00374 family)